VCDGTGFVDDEVTRTVDAVPVPAAADRPAPDGIAVGGHPAQVPRRGLRPPARPGDRGEVRPAGPAVRGFVRDIDAQLDAGAGLWFYGGPGDREDDPGDDRGQGGARRGEDRGDLLAAAAARRDPDDLRRRHGHLYTRLLDRLTEVDLLHVDDVGAQMTTPWVLEQLYAIVNARYEEQRSIVLTTNIELPDELAEQITPRTVSRLKEMCEVLPIFGTDARSALGATEERIA
jgi:DNA replication protein DnaC